MGTDGDVPDFLSCGFEKIPRGRRLWHPTLAQKAVFSLMTSKRPRKDGAPGRFDFGFT